MTEPVKQTDNGGNAVMQRLIGAIVLIAAALVLIPILFPAKEQRAVITQTLEIPEKPEIKKFEVYGPEPAQLPIEETPLPVTTNVEGSNANTTVAGSGEIQRIEQPAQEAAAEAPGSVQQTPDRKVVESKTPSKPAFVATANKKPALPEAWLLQIGNFTSQENANRLILKAQDKGFRVYSRTEKAADGKLHTKVLIGPKLDRERAEKKKVEIEQALGLQSFLVEFKPGDRFFKVNFND